MISMVIVNTSGSCVVSRLVAMRNGFPSFVERWHGMKSEGSSYYRRMTYGERWSLRRHIPLLFVLMQSRKTITRSNDMSHMITRSRMIGLSMIEVEATTRAAAAVEVVEPAVEVALGVVTSMVKAPAVAPAIVCGPPSVLPPIIPIPNLMTHGGGVVVVERTLVAVSVRSVCSHVMRAIARHVRM
jgi:hypothetical protein